jgi:hypothetical protein
MILSDDAGRYLDQNGRIDHLEVVHCPRCRQEVFLTPGEQPRPGEVCGDCLEQWWGDLDEVDQLYLDTETIGG